ncbi:uracil phosphoribosyltransferase [Hydrogenivirga sp. 128-5-R1-1]|uniref:uracil phosphoribosyltransferase n=1 Tax=Hydrogenivirga sp. 128-5-R1-1 TaxID=392423 RepID=UPI00015EF9FB|nr:uracil phosphoribosyltransferase [Hydrogenivirga sp. 128-5-R1-1]EDP75149.1 uracil phosphoribosyltransferase [Hydrogenivirga sp. 128-5-R1-1]
MVRELRHPILVHKLNRIRDLSTPREVIRRLLEDIAVLMVYEALQEVELHRREIEIWLGKREFDFVREEDVVFVPILRAGVPMLEGALRVLPNASSGFIAIKRDEETLESKVFYSRLPDLEGMRVLILDPMLATGGTLLKALSEVKRHKPTSTASLHIICAPEGVERIDKAYPEHRLYTVSIDERLNDKGYIVPGLGDMGDRLFS